MLLSKFEEIYAPEVNEFVFITDDTYTRQQVLRMEHLMIKVSLLHSSKLLFLNTYSSYRTISGFEL